MSGSRIIEGNATGVDGSPNFSSIKIVRQKKSGKSCKSRPDWKPVTLETVAKPQNKKKKDSKKETSQSLSVSSRKKLSRMLQRH